MSDNGGYESLAEFLVIYLVISFYFACPSYKTSRRLGLAFIAL
jgi:hypothetical protein